jgi:hypothetical protein
MHWTKRRKYFLKWAWLVAAYAECDGHPNDWERLPRASRPIDPAAVRIVQYRKRLLDIDNLYASCKPILDALVKCGLIKDDSPDHCKLSVFQMTGKNIGTEITIGEVTE